jgi:hypothetical protein
LDRIVSIEAFARSDPKGAPRALFDRALFEESGTNWFGLGRVEPQADDLAPACGEPAAFLRR